MVQLTSLPGVFPSPSPALTGSVFPGCYSSSSRLIVVVPEGASQNYSQTQRQAAGQCQEQGTATLPAGAAAEREETEHPPALTLSAWALHTPYGTEEERWWWSTQLFFKAKIMNFRACAFTTSWDIKCL